MNKITITLLAIVLLLFASCKKEYPTIYMSDEMKQYVMQPVGSWWIYQDSATGNIDSVYLHSQTISIDSGDGGDDLQYPFEKLKQSFFSSNQGNYVCEIEYPPLINAKNENVLRYACMGHYVDKLSIGENCGYYTYIAFYDSMQINNVWYKKIKQYHQRVNDNYYWARNIGLICWTYNSHGKRTSINLLKYHANQ